MAIRFVVDGSPWKLTRDAVIPERVGVILAILLRGFSPQNIVYNYVHLCRARRKMYHSYPGDTAYTREGLARQLMTVNIFIISYSVGVPIMVQLWLHE